MGSTAHDAYPRGAGISPEDARIVAGQVGSGRVVPGEVLRRCRHGYPCLVALGPERDAPGREEGRVPYGAVADLLWLTCPFLHDAIHRLESEGYVRRIGSRVDGDRDSRFDFISLRRKRFPRLLSGDPDDPALRAIAASGVGGSRGGAGLKCLHAHFAHYLANGRNAAGRITSRLLGDALECDDARCGKLV